ncbi:MAG: tRNA nucleotidyltransferase (CCA-adding enzyme) [Gammaproteobacteria bacterium]|jgi:tRNA nucleotidyltransferase (CCA-adding enzyme)
MTTKALAPVQAIARAVHDAGGRAIIVGGEVRDRLLGADAGEDGGHDTDIELFGLDEQAATRVLSAFGRVIPVGRAFGVLRVAGLDIDFSLPRLDSRGHGVRGDLTRSNPELDFADAARRRDLTINAMGFDPLTEELLDPFGGRDDLERGCLRAADTELFAEDPVRGLRVARFAARFGMQADDELKVLCSQLDLSQVAPERLFDEWRKLLRQAKTPSLALRFLHDVGLLHAFPELHALIGVPQDARWHPEGDVWVHTLMVLDVASSLRLGDATDDALMFAALCHDLGKPATTECEEDSGRIRSLAHERAGVAVTQAFLGAMRAPQELIRGVGALVLDHLAPAQFPSQGAGRAAYRRLARRLHDGGVSIALLERLARADQWGRTTSEAQARVFDAGDLFLVCAAEFGVSDRAPLDAVQGRHLIARGHQPGPEFSSMLKRCRALQDKSGLDDPHAILDRLGIVGPA